MPGPDLRSRAALSFDPTDPPRRPPVAPPSRVAVTGRDLACVRGGRLVFSGLSFSAGPGDLLAVIGPNGCGKSSLLRIVAGLLRPEAGVLVVGGGAEDALCHYLGHADALKPALTLRETLAFWAALYAGGRDPARSPDAAAHRVGLGHALDLRVGALSAGQRRRAGLARLLLSPRPIWLLDEPASALDRDGEALLGSLLGAHLAEGGMAIAATHSDLPVAPTRILDLAAAP